MKSETTCVLIALLFTLVPLGIASAQTSISPGFANDRGTGASAISRTAPFASRDPRYRIGRGDAFDLDFAKSPEFNQTLIVQPDGYISLRAIGDVKVIGQTIPELSETIRKVYAPILHNPRIAILLKEFEKPYFVAGGWLEKPGKYDLRGDTTVLQAIQIAGGMKEGAKTSQVFLFRSRDDDWFEVKTLNLKRIVAGKDLSEDLHLRPRDMILVPQGTFSKIAPFLPRTSVGSYFAPGNF
jgi:polysaccharide biosynthesis/export protein